MKQLAVAEQVDAIMGNRSRIDAGEDACDKDSVQFLDRNAIIRETRRSEG